MNILENLNIENNNNEFFQSTFGQIVDFSLETGLRAILPNSIEDEVINIKNTLINEGLSEAVNKAIDTAINFGKSALGIITGNFENIDQVEMAVKKGGLIDSISNGIDFVLNKIEDFGILPKKITGAIKSGKDVLLGNISEGFKDEFLYQNENLDELEKYNELWKESFNNQDFEQMDIYYKKINGLLEDTMPIENIIQESKNIENLHTLIKNNDKNFDLTDEQIELAKLLTN